MFCEDTLDRSPVPGCFGKNGDITYLDWMLSAWGWTVSVSVLALLLALASGMIIGVLRTLPNNKWAVRFGNAWVEFFRNIPLLVQIFLWYHVIPAIFPALKSVSGFVLVVLALGFFTSARIAEQVRSGIEALPRGQRHAAMAMGFTTWQVYRYVLLPNALRIIIPPLTSETMNIFKNSSRGLCRLGGRADHVRHAGAGRNWARGRGVPGSDGPVRHFGLCHQPHHGLD